MSAMKKRKSLTIEEKRNIILSLESGCSNTFISQQYDLSHSTVSNIFKQRTEIKQMFDQAAFTKKKIRFSMHRDIEKALLEWFKCHKDSRVSINIQLLQAKADEFGKLFGKTNFKCSSSWVQRFKRRHCNEFAKTVGSKSKEQIQRVENSCAKVTTCGAAQSVAADWLQNVWPALREGFSDEEIYTANETGVFYRLMPDQSFKFQRQRCTEGEFSKERLTVLITANLTMTDKKKLLVIGKFKNPRSFKNLKTLPVQYEYNQKAWMTSSIFNQFLQKWDVELCQEGKNVLVLIDDSSAHSQLDQQLRSIRVVCLPNNNPSLVKSMHQRITKSLKLQFKKQLILCHIKNIENNRNTKINIFQAICMLESAWQQIIPQTNCFGRAALKEVNVSVKEENLNSWASNLLDYDTETLEQFENVDTELVTSDQISSVESNTHCCDKEEEINIEESDDDEEIEKVTLNHAFDALNRLKQFFATEEHFSKSYNHTKQLQILLDKSLYKQKKSQTKITSYFKKIF